MIDFLRANTWCSQEEYKWEMTVPQIRLASMDFSHIEYLTGKEKSKNKNKKSLKNAKEINGAKDLALLNDLGVPVI